MPVFWGNRNRHDHHDHHTNVATGTRVIAANDGHRHRGAATVVAVPATNISSAHGHGTHVTTSRDRRRYYSNNPSTAHGMWNKVLGALTGNRRRRRHGEREMRKAREQKEALRIARGVQRDRETGHMNKLRKFRQRRRHRHHDPAVIAQDSGRRQGRTPWMHYSHRTLPPYHGLHHRFFGLFTRGGERRARGKAMAAAAEEERRRERRHRREQMREDGRRYRERMRR